MYKDRKKAALVFWGKRRLHDLRKLFYPPRLITLQVVSHQIKQILFGHQNREYFTVDSFKAKKCPRVRKIGV